MGSIPIGRRNAHTLQSFTSDAYTCMLSRMIFQNSTNYKTFLNYEPPCAIKFYLQIMERFQT
jgi:hypothetical protein